MESTNGKSVLLKALLGAATVFILGFISFSVYTLNNDKIQRGVHVGKVDVSGLTKAQAIQKVTSQLQGIETASLTLKHSEKKWSIPYSSVYTKDNIAEAVGKAYSIGKTGSVIQRIADSFKSTDSRVSVPLGYNKDSLLQEIAAIQKDVDVQKKNAAVVLDGDKVVVIPHAVGHRLDVDNTLQAIESNINSFASGEIELPVLEDHPELLDKDLDGITDVLGSYSTAFNSGDKNRTHNIKLATSRINGTILKPGQVFSMDSTLKNRTFANGYKTAKAYFQDEIVEEVGGGVCQVTTTLYDAVLTANIQVVERTQHSMTVDYVNPGYDATVSDKGVDFKFENTTNTPVYLYSAVEGNKIVMKIFGKNDNPGQKIELESEVTDILYAQPEEIILDPSLPSGLRKVEYKSKNGYRANLYKNIYNNGILMSRELISQNLYKPLRGKIKVNS